MRGHRITLLCHAKDRPNWQGLGHLYDFLEDLIVVPRPSRRSPSRLLRGVWSLRRPMVATVNGCNPTYARAFAALLETGFDLVQVEHSYAFEPLARALKFHHTPFVLSEHNVESTVVDQQFVRLPQPFRALGRLDAVRYRTWEKDVIRRAACVIAVTPEDEAAFQRLGAKSTALVPNCIDSKLFSGVTPDHAAQKVLFVGNYEYAPNLDAVERLCERIMPLLWQTNPHVQLVICGHAMPATWRRRWTDSRILFEGFVKSLPQLHASSSVFVAPLRSGGGSKLKVLEAMASALPVVGTRESVSGLAVRDQMHFLAGENDQEIATALGTALSNPELASLLGTEARQYIARHHDWAVAADALEQVYSTFISGNAEGMRHVA